MTEYTQRTGGQMLSAGGDTVPAIVGCIDEPTARDVATDGLDFCRFRGWAASTRGRPVTVIARVGDEPPREFVAHDPRPDVVDALRATHGLTDPSCGFCIDVELPEPETDGAGIPIAIELADGELVARAPEFQIYRGPHRGARRSKQVVAAKHLHGEGVEFGALHQPLEVDSRQCVVRYADRLTKPEAEAKFPELRDSFDVVEVDFIVDLDHDDLSELRSQEFDFFIANDVIEHLANPVRFLENVHDVMKPGAVLFLSVPDRDYTFDHARDLTSPEHLWREHDRNVTRVSASHLRDFIRHTEPGGLPRNPWRRQRLYRAHRERSIHVHVWTQVSFDEFLARTIERIPLRFEIVDQVESRDAAGSMVYVLRRG